MKHELLIKSLINLQTDMRDIAIDLRRLYPETTAGGQLDTAAGIISKWIDNIQQNNFTE